MEQKIIQVMRTVREGVSKKTNKPYQILLVMVEDGSEVEVFGPAKQGDVVTEITHNEQYDKLQGRVIKADKNEEVLTELKGLRAELQSVMEAVSLLLESAMTTQAPAPPVARPVRPAPPKAPEPPAPSLLDEKLKAWRVPRTPANEPPPSDEDMPDFDDQGDPEDGR